MATRTPFGESIYREYAGPLSKPGNRWKVIARHMIKTAFHKRAFWILTFLAGVHYFLTIIITYFLESASTRAGSQEMTSRFYSQMVWKDEFLHGFALGHFFLMAVVLFVGAGCIANDNKTNALLVYLSKTCTKLDYLVGKWLGVFVPVCTALLLPALFYFIYGMLNFREYGFLSDDPRLIWQVPLAIVLGAAFQTSLILGISSFFRDGRMAGATYAGLYVLSGLFAGIASIASSEAEVPAVFQNLLYKVHYFSIYGVVEAGYKVIFNTNGARTFMNESETVLPRPELGLWLALYILPTLFFLFIAYRRVRAVEVVQ